MNETVFLAGASGAVGTRQVPILVGAGYRVVGSTRTEQGAQTLRALGAEAVVVDAFDAAALASVVEAARPQIVIHQLTGLSALRDGHIPQAQAENARVRTIGTRNLVDASRAAGVRRLIAQSIAWVYAPGPLPHLEADPLDVSPQGASMTVQGVVALEKAVLGCSALEGVVLRYGRFHGPGTGRDEPGESPSVHVDAAAHAALLAMDRARPGSVFNIADPNGMVSTEKATVELGWNSEFRLTTVP